ncbi:MAG: exodeoxyribonuclease III [Denitrovibrio sp.]|nr:MAG: exodeoxyribonuclease III [Denitrovibrio sp.]
MKIVTFNVNSIRMRYHQLEKLIENHSPDIIGLQETKVRDEEFPVEEIDKLGYHVEYFGQKTHYGVAVMSKVKPVAVQKGFPTDDDEAQKRFIMCDFGDLKFMNGYFPQGESRDHPVKFPAKEKYYADLLNYLDTSFNPSDNIVLVGDMNVAPTEFDVGIKPDSVKRWLKQGKTSFLPEERGWLQSITDWGLEEVYRKLRPEDSEQMSWFDYRSKGFEAEPKRGLRIDLVLATAGLSSRCVDVGIDYEVRGMDKPSDHAPLWVKFD